MAEEQWLRLEMLRGETEGIEPTPRNLDAAASKVDRVEQTIPNRHQLADR